ncbi:MAG: protoporphyrinogen oxidase [Nitriliruptoraceae bacterium]
MAEGSSAPRRVVVIGAGLTGLAAAWHLREHAEVRVLEASSRLGGAVHTIVFDGVPFDVGADAFLARQPHAVGLARQVGLGDDLVAPATSRVLLARGRRLRRLPEATLMGVPGSVLALARSGAVPFRGVLRAGLEPLIGRPVTADDVSVAELVGARFGSAVVDHVVEPLLGGVYAGRADQLSARATVPPLFALASQRSLLRALARRDRSAGGPGHPGAPAGPVFQTLRGGLSTLVDRLAADLDVERDRAVTGVRRDEGGFVVETDAGPQTADDVVMAVPAAVAARLLRDLAPDVAAALSGFTTASVAVVALALEGGRLPDASGLLVPRTEGRMVKAATFSTRKWPHHRDHSRTLLRASVGRVDDERHRDLGDDDLVAAVDRDLRELLRHGGTVAASHVVRWDRALPQYAVGHLDAVADVRDRVARVPGLHVGGAALDGVGLAARCADGQRMAEAVLARTSRPSA